MAAPAEDPRLPTPVLEAGGFGSALRAPAFRLIWFAQVAAQLADKFLMFSLIILAYHLSGGSTPVAVTLLAYTVPAVVIAPFAGVFADRRDRKAIMVWTNWVRAGVIALIPISSLVPALTGDYWHLLVLTLLFSGVGQLFGPAEAAAIPSVVPRRALLAANSLVLITMVGTLVAGGALAPLVSRYDIYAPYWLASLLFVLAGSLIFAARIPRLAAVREGIDQHPVSRVVGEMREGMAVLRSSPPLLLSFYQLSVAVLVMFMMFTLAPGYVSQVVGIGEQDSYVILLPATAGAVLAALLLGQWGRKLNRVRMLVAGLFLTGATLGVLAFVPFLIRHGARLEGNELWYMAALSLLLGLGFGSLMIPSLTYLMENTEDAVRGRVFAMLFMVINGVTALPVLAAAALSDTFGIDRVIAALGLLLILTAVATGPFASRAFGRR